MRAEVFAQQQSLHLSHLERTQDPPQACHAETITLRLTQHFSHQRLPALLLGLAHNPVGMLSHLLVRNGGHIRREAPQQPLLQIGMQVRLEFAPIHVLAADDQLLEPTLFLRIFQALGKVFEVAHRLVGDPALRVSRIVTAESITAAVTRQAVEEPIAFGQFVQAKVEKPSPLAIDQGYTHSRLRPQKRGQRLEVKTPIDE